MTRHKINLGLAGEEAAVKFLENQGYRILQRNFRNSVGEMDVVARDGRVLCFVEVKTRINEAHGHPLESITEGKKKKLIRTALSYLQLHGLTDAQARFDVVAVIPNPDGGHHIEIVKDAFETE
jgi:putative endonuclease